MQLPPTVFDPAFNITRASHIVLTVDDLDASRRFYEEVIGLITSAADADAVYLRGVEEACHHSLVLRRGSGTPGCTRIGMRVVNEDHLARAHDVLAEMGCTVSWAEAPYQGRTLHVTDPVGTPLELCARMDAMPRMITRFSTHKGGAAGRLDHYQILTPEVGKALAFYNKLGFRLTEYIMPPGGEVLGGVFLQRKGNPHDIVFFNGIGPRLHHFAYTVAEGANLLRACDVAGELGYGRKVERGPGRHGPGHAMFVYFRDPAGHRIELFNTHYQVMDLENEPVGWDPADSNISFPWGLPAQRRWFEEATPFEGVTSSEPAARPNPLSLERFLAALDAG
ncbi:VOC family protein [Roseomonas populi]|uniref:VOC family protein n=1 Tax=Roseomonas populi TaxID=3121582 RepID=A0ABT1XC72_9PROT|nr:VOC family protein [Roseomonas pecuniae]MCR0985700.1 VOC family protein [Roseomonas pecuniae]